MPLLPPTWGCGSSSHRSLDGARGHRQCGLICSRRCYHQQLCQMRQLKAMKSRRSQPGLRHPRTLPRPHPRLETSSFWRTSPLWPSQRQYGYKLRWCRHSTAVSYHFESNNLTIECADCRTNSWQEGGDIALNLSLKLNHELRLEMVTRIVTHSISDSSHFFWLVYVVKLASTRV